MKNVARAEDESRLRVFPVQVFERRRQFIPHTL
jgi:hypothetical protein